MAKKYREQTITGQLGVNLIERRVLQMGWVWNSTNIEAGIDGYIEIRDVATGQATNYILQVQSKATAGTWVGETGAGFDWVCDERDLDYWLSGNAPVILVVSRPAAEEAYWVAIKDYFKDKSKRQSRRVSFSKTSDVFDASAREKLQSIAMPRYSGVYLRPPPRTETLMSNLLPVARVADHVFIGSTDFQDGRAVRRHLGWQNSQDEWIAKRKQILSFHDLSIAPWQEIVDQGTVETFSVNDWLRSDDAERQAEFIELLTHCLRARLRRLGVAYFRDGDYFYFMASHDLSARRVRYRSLRRFAERTVVIGKAKPDDLSRMRYYRHAAFSSRFLKCGESWYLAITPTYHFTSDGWRRHLFYENKLKGIKALEKNNAVLGQVAMWAALLKDDNESLFADPYPFLGFGDLWSGAVEAGVNELWWLSNEEDDATKRSAAEGDLSSLLALQDSHES